MTIAKKPTTPKHQVTASLKNWELTKLESAVEFKIKNGEKLFGTLKIGRGSLRWTPANKQKAIKKTWPDFAKLMEP